MGTNYELSGKLIAVEGLDGSGKSTQIYLLKHWLELEGYKIFFTEWNSSTTVKEATKKGKKRQVRHLELAARPEAITPYSMISARARFIEVNESRVETAGQEVSPSAETAMRYPTPRTVSTAELLGPSFPLRRRTCVSRVRDVASP